jgi:hypothetical protein
MLLSADGGYLNLYRYIYIKLKIQNSKLKAVPHKLKEATSFSSTLASFPNAVGLKLEP